MTADWRPSKRIVLCRGSSFLFFFPRKIDRRISNVDRRYLRFIRGGKTHARKTTWNIWESTQDYWSICGPCIEVLQRLSCFINDTCITAMIYEMKKGRTRWRRSRRWHYADGLMKSSRNIKKKKKKELVLDGNKRGLSANILSLCQLSCEIRGDVANLYVYRVRFIVSFGMYRGVCAKLYNEKFCSLHMYTHTHV